MTMMMKSVTPHSDISCYPKKFHSKSKTLFFSFGKKKKKNESRRAFCFAFIKKVRVRRVVGAHEEGFVARVVLWCFSLSLLEVTTQQKNALHYISHISYSRDDVCDSDSHRAL